MSVLLIITDISIFVLEFLFFDWHARMIFIAQAYRRRYGHGKSWKRAYDHYKKNWTLTERLLWVFAFKERYGFDHRFLAYLSYAHFVIMIASTLTVLIGAQYLTDRQGLLIGIVYAILSLLRWSYSNAIARGTI